jgi:hypothetical protein
MSHWNGVDVLSIEILQAVRDDLVANGYMVRTCNALKWM